MPRPSIATLLEQVSELKTKQDRIEALRQLQGNTTLLKILQLAFDPKIKFALPEGEPPYTPCPFLDQEGMLYSEARRLYLFLDPESGGNPNLTNLKREQLFVGLLECLMPQDAKLLCAVKDKSIPYKNITAQLVKEAFPGLIDEQVTEAA